MVPKDEAELFRLKGVATCRSRLPELERAVRDAGIDLDALRSNPD